MMMMLIIKLTCVCQVENGLEGAGGWSLRHWGQRPPSALWMDLCSTLRVSVVVSAPYLCCYRELAQISGGVAQQKRIRPLKGTWRSKPIFYTRHFLAAKR